MFKNSMLFCLSFLLLSACADNDPGKSDVSASKPAEVPVAEQLADSADSSESPAESSEQKIDVGRDYHSLSNPEQVRVKHIVLDLTVDFDQKVMRGTAALDYQKVDPAATVLVLDSKELSINKVTSDGQDLAFTLQSDNSSRYMTTWRLTIASQNYR